MVTNIRCAAEQIKSDKVEIVVTGGVKIGEFGKVGNRQNLQSIVMNGIKVGKVGMSENSQTDEERGRRENLQVNHKRHRKTQS